MKLTISPLYNYDFKLLAETFNAAFRKYIVKILPFDAETFSTFLTEFSVDLNLSRLVVIKDKISGIALISRFNNASRLAGMGIIPEYTGRGVGSWMLRQLIMEAAERADRQCMLEVIEQNRPAVGLYEKCDFKTIRRLYGFSAANPAGSVTKKLKPVSVYTLIRALTETTCLHLPWQMALPCLVKTNAPFRIYRYDDCFAVISDPASETIMLKSLFSISGFDDTVNMEKCLNAVTACHPDHQWKVPAYYPEELRPVFLNCGFKQIDINQLQMVRELC